MVVNVVPTATVPGLYSYTFSVGTADASGNTLAVKDFTVSFFLAAHLAIVTAPIVQTMVFGDTTVTTSLPISVTAPDRQWTPTSDAAWLHVPATSQSGNASVIVTIDDTGLAPGTYDGHIQFVSNLETDDTASLPVRIVVTPPSLDIVGTAAYTFGGSDGRFPLVPQTLSFSLTTGQASYPYTLKVSTDSGGQWLAVNSYSGIVGSTGTSVDLSVNSSSVRGGTYAGHVSISTVVKGLTLRQDVPVTFNLEANRLIVTASGVGLSKIAGVEVLTRTVKVLSALDSTNIPWTASSDRAWLSVTPSGVTGGGLVLTANPTGLPLDTTQFATVTIKSSDLKIENQQSIRVGLFVSNTAPVNVSVNIAANNMATSPVEPIVAIGTGGKNIGIYDINSGTLSRTLSNVVATSSTLTFSEDGQTLFVYDSTNLLVAAVDPVTGIVQKTYPLMEDYVGNYALIAIHPNGYPLLMTPSPYVYDLVTGERFIYSEFSSLRKYLKFSKSSSQWFITTEDGLVLQIVRSAVGGGILAGLTVTVISTAQSIPSAGETCFSPLGDRIYTGSAFPDFYAASFVTNQIIQTLPGTSFANSIECVWNDLVIGGDNAYYAPNDIFVYYGPTGASLGSISSNGQTAANRSLLPRGLAVSADGTRLMSAWASSPGINTTSSGVYFNSLPAPSP